LGEQQVNDFRGGAMKKVSTTPNGTGLTMRWVPVTTDDGRVRMEMRWSAPHTLRKRPAA